MTTTLVAPDFRNHYPSRGAMIGPAWQAAWELMTNQRGWFTKSDLCAVMSRAGGTVAKTNENLLTGAVKAGLLERRLRLQAGRRRAEYRLTAKGRTERKDASA